jgi:MarR family transcriptional regulator, transcriptional regulator for hemolysin
MLNFCIASILTPPGMDPFDQTLMNLTASLTHAARAYKSAADKVAADYGLSQATGLPVLILGRLGNGVRPGVLADALGIDPSSLVRVIDHLIDGGLLERREDAQDRRAKTLHLTAEGEQRAQQMEKALVPFRRKLFGDVAPADIDACLRVMGALNTALAKPADQGQGRKAA